MKYAINSTETVGNCLSKLELLKCEVLIVIDSKNKLIGSISDGDIRRALMVNGKFDIEDEVLKYANTKVFSLNEWEVEKSDLEVLLQKYKVIPIVDDKKHVLRVLDTVNRYFSIPGVWNSDSTVPYIIAEIGNNHNGSLELAIEMIESAKECGADCAKFQMRTMSGLYNMKSNSMDLGTEYTLDLLGRFQLKDEELYVCFDHCKSLGMMPLCTPWDIDSLNKLEEYGMEAYKIASADLTNHALLRKIAETKKPMFLSTGMSTEEEIISTVNLLNSLSANYMLLHCNSTYPTPFKDVNLGYIKQLKRISCGPVGYSGHERGINICFAAYTLGAQVIEKHFTFDKSMEGNDHQVSLLPEELKSLVEGLTQIESSVSTHTKRKLTQGELINRENLAKSIIASTSIIAGDEISIEMLDFKSPGIGLQPNRVIELLGKTAKRNFNPGDYFWESDIVGNSVNIEAIQFERPYGVPVRYHDFNLLYRRGGLSFVEFHLSYKDLTVPLEEVFKDYHDVNYAIHAPELFQGDHILDLASENESYRNKSILHLQATISHALKIGKYFKNENPKLIVNVGGWSIDDFIEDEQRASKYELLRKSLASVDLSGVELSIQTMPPYPWHFGGQRFHNLFVHPEEIKRFCEETGFKICLDVSHSMMACNFLGIDFISEYFNVVKNYVNYLHIVDAQGVDGEGIQIGQGDVDFDRLCNSLNEHLPNVAFVPEVWQGHKDNGSGFWEAMDYLLEKGLR